MNESMRYYYSSNMIHRNIKIYVYGSCLKLVVKFGGLGHCKAMTNPPYIFNQYLFSELPSLYINYVLMEKINMLPNMAITYLCSNNILHTISYHSVCCKPIYRKFHTLNIF